MTPRHQLASLRLWLDETPRDGALNMALDEAMLRAADEPWLRVYAWRERSISIGFSQPLNVVPAVQESWPLVRRWTGGGAVVHDGDWTYTLAFPAAHEWSVAQTGDSYRWIHEAFIDALSACGISGAMLQPVSSSDGIGVCFVEPARHDVMLDGRKIAGAAQRRTKAGMLHQGSVQLECVPQNLASDFASQLSRLVKTTSQHDAESLLLDQAMKLVATKYGTQSWLHDRKAAVA